LTPPNGVSFVSVTVVRSLHLGASPVQPLRGGGYGFNIKTKPYTWLTLHYETKEVAEEGRIHALKATEKATSAHLHRK
jgi:hypothetical protein